MVLPAGGDLGQNGDVHALSSRTKSSNRAFVRV